MLKADKSFLKKLREISPNLEVVFEPELKRWVVWYRNVDSGMRYRIYEVHNEDGTYRALDDRLIEMLKQWDMRTKVDDPAYLVSKQLANAKKRKEEIRRKNRLEALERSRELNKKWGSAIDNAMKGIIYESQVYTPKIYSIPSPRASAGLVDLSGRAISSK